MLSASPVSMGEAAQPYICELDQAGISHREASLLPQQVVAMQRHGCVMDDRETSSEWRQSL
jgi:hypothetical protein